MRIRKSVATFIMLALMGVATYVSAQEISRNNEGRYFYTSITIPPGAETMYSVSYTHLTLPTICSV